MKRPPTDRPLLLTRNWPKEKIGAENLHYQNRPGGISAGEVYTFSGVWFLPNLRCRFRLHLNRFPAEVAIA
jgi:hypothetical protein